MTSPTTVVTPGPSIPAPTERTLHRAGGVAAHVVSGTYVIGLLAMFAYLVPQGFIDPLTDPAGSLEFLSGHPTVLYAWYLVLYLVGGSALPVVVLALHDRLRPHQPILAMLARAFGLIWSGLLLASGMIALIGQRAALDLAASDNASAVASWHAVCVVQDALGGGIEVVGASWLLLTCLAGLRSRALPMGLSVLGVGAGVAGLVTLRPAAADVAASVFGFALIVWFTWTAHTLLAGAKIARRQQS
jgi:hypothetical protein